jgi:asparagine synthase (glutamine-hydrolysing)
MCGIFGILGHDPNASPEPVAAALAALQSRGPDQGARHDARLGAHAVVFAARRLALLDRAGGAQPFLRPSGAMLVWNGEIYNHAALRRDLEARGAAFRTRSDTEVLAVLLERDGVAGLARIEGSFALAFLGSERGPLLLARDRLGVRPLAWARTQRGIVFASTVEALAASGCVARAADPVSIADVLKDGVVHGTRSALAGVRRVRPGGVVRVTSDLAVAELDLPPAEPMPASADVDPEAGVLEALRAAVADRLALDRTVAEQMPQTFGPAGVFLSGGIDSALVAALSRDHGRFPTYTVAFPGHPELDEAPRAARTAAKLGLIHHEISCPEDPTSWVLGAARAFDEPFADASAVPTWGLARSAGAAVRAVLTGTGGDEVFGGYRRYWLLGTGPWLRHVPAFVRAPVSAVLDRAAPSGARVLRAAADPEGLYRGLLRLQGPDEFAAVAGPALDGIAAFDGEAGPASAVAAMADDRTRYLPDDLLVKEDRALMAHGVEGRHPFLDRRVAAAASKLEIRGGTGRGRQKQVLRAYVREIVDPDLAAGAKMGFAFPCDALYGGPLLHLTQDLLFSRRARERGFTDPATVERLVRDHAAGRKQRGAVVHALVMLELWARRVLDGRD